MASPARRSAGVAARGKALIPKADFEEQLAAAEAVAGFGIWRWARGAYDVQASSGLARLVGLLPKPRNILVRSLLRRVTAADRGVLIRAVRSGVETQAQIVVADSKGRARRIYSVAFRPSATGLWGIVQDVTMLGQLEARIGRSEAMDIAARKDAEAESAHLSRRLELALEVSGLGIFEANLLTREVYWDKRVRDVHGVPVDFVLPPDYWERTLHPEDHAAAMQNVWNAVENQSGYVSDHRIVRPDGAIRYVHTAGTWYRDADGVPKMLGVDWDMTHEVLDKQELKRARTLAETRNAELEATKAAIEHNAMHDALTGLPNRRFLDVFLAERASWAKQTGGPVGVLHIDLDLFKQINDTLGHVAGDAMLMHVAELLGATAGKDAFVARVGGDEFSIVCATEESNGPALAVLADEIISRIRRPVPYEGLYCRFGASIGIAIQMGAEVDPKRLLIDADIALYRAKGRGKNCFEFFTNALRAEAVNAKRIADDIMRGIEQNEFSPYFQPMFDAQSMSLVAVEALARWRHPAQGILDPASFLRIAEAHNMVTAIDRTVLEQALACFGRWRTSGLDVPSISVNVSFRRLHEQELLANLRDLSIVPGTVSFELLESIFLDELDDIMRWNLDHIREMGIGIDIDDFGTGHASIIGLLRLRPQRFKLDRQFLEGLTTSGAQQRLVRSIIDIGKSLGIKVVAEGVETMDQAQMLADLGCDILQGFAFAMPMSADDLESFLRDQRRHRASWITRKTRRGDRRGSD